MDTEKTLEAIDTITMSASQKVMQHIATLKDSGQDPDNITGGDLMQVATDHLDTVLKEYSTKDKEALLKKCFNIFVIEYINAITGTTPDQVIETTRKVN